MNASDCFWYGRSKQLARPRGAGASSGYTCCTCSSSAEQLVGADVRGPAGATEAEGPGRGADGARATGTGARTGAGAAGAGGTRLRQAERAAFHRGSRCFAAQCSCHSGQLEARASHT